MVPSDPRTDSDLIAASNAGDAGAFEGLYYRYRDWVVRLALRFTGHHEDALDVLQDTFAYLLRKLPALRLSARMTTFLYPVVRNLALARRRKRAREAGDPARFDELPAAEEATPPPTFVPDTGVTTGSAAEGLTNGRARALGDLAAVLNVLPAPQREVLLMRFVDDMELSEIAASLSIPLGTVKSRLHHALRTLRADERTRRYFEA